MADGFDEEALLMAEELVWTNLMIMVFLGYFEYFCENFLFPETTTLKINVAFNPYF